MSTFPITLDHSEALFRRADGTPFRVAAIVPCHDEEASIGKVVRDLFDVVSGIDVYVYDNCSSDRTAERAQAAGALVRTETSKGKGNVVRRAFADIDADIYLLIDGDDTYDVAAAPRLIQTLIEGPYDHILGVREQEESATNAYRPAHEQGNRALNRIVAAIFGRNDGDMLSGYRVMSRRFVKSFPAVSKEFEIETELTVHSLALRVPSTSVQVGFRDRAEGSESKLRTYRDGTKILSLIVSLARHEKPMAYYGFLALLLQACAVLLGAPVLVHYFDTGLVPRVPTLFFGLVLLVLGFLAVACGLILDGMRKTRHELSRLSYLQHPALATSATIPLHQALKR